MGLARTLDECSVEYTCYLQVNKSRLLSSRFYSEIQPRLNPAVLLRNITVASGAHMEPHDVNRNYLYSDSSWQRTEYIYNHHSSKTTCIQSNMETLLERLPNLNQ